ncbi:mucin-5AC [Anopheles maculipalpis]|uniref:mucin-5AC n=1 Tax=Anopheles maculipalpis TaxID=1496333 RepID=UPI002158B036|nr:mucin-5AC [Anopheles maculipalpis]
MQSIRIASFVPVMLLLLLATLADGLPYPRPMPQNLRRLPRRNDFVAYNLHRIIRPRDVNDLGVDQARKAMHDVHETIAEVQRLLSLDPSLPRLTRGEIEELFENVTREEFAKSLRAGDHHRAQHMRALMLVLPYHANNMSPENMQKIYTRPPVTRIVGAASNTRPVGVETLPMTPARFVASSTTTTTTTTTAAPTTSGARTTAAPIPVTTIRFTTPRPTTFHPTLPERMRDASYHRKENMNEILAAIGLSQSSEELSTPPTFRPLPADMTTIAPFSSTSVSSVTEDPINNAINVDDPKVAQELKELLRSFGLLKEADSEASANSPLPQAERLVDIQPAALVLHEPLKVEESTPTIEEPKKPEVQTTGGLTQASVKADDYVAFKPLPIGTSMDEGDAKPIDEELDALLKSFGLLGPGPRNKKSMHPEPTHKPPTQMVMMKTVPSIDADLVAPQLMSVLGTLGIQMKNGQQEASPSTGVTPLIRRREKTPRKLDPPVDQTPSAAHLRVSNEDYRKLEQLWQTVKQLEKLNASLTDDSLDVLNPKHYNLSPSLLAQGPDPLLDNVDAREKLNEIKKRQEPATSTTTATTITTTTSTASSVQNDDSAAVTESDSPFRFSLQLNTGGGGTTSDDSELDESLAKLTTTETSSDTTTISPTTNTTPSTTTTTTESARNAALEDSFPSSDLAGDPVNEEPLPPPRRNGFYFLYDWNTFLEVGEEPNKVIIRYNPQAGDPSRFLPVTVP